MIHTLVFVQGYGIGQSIRLEPREAPLSLGRDESRHLCVFDARASRLHAYLRYLDNQWHIEDAHSLNGTYLNSELVDQAPLDSGDLIRIGDTLMLFMAGDESFKQKAPARPPAHIIEQTTEIATAGDDLGKLPVNCDSRRLATLCRLATGAMRARNVAHFAQLTQRALIESTDATEVRIWKRGARGRLVRIDGEQDAEQCDHFLATMAIERGQGLLMDLSPAGSEDRQPSGRGTAMCCVIPGKSGGSGAVECVGDPNRVTLTLDDLNFLDSIAHLLGLAIEHIEHREKIEQANETMRSQLAQHGRLIGSSAALNQLRERIHRVAKTDSTTLILGETGTGKELVARTVHEASHRAAGPFVAVNCAAFSDSLLESELFGHERGAFTGADRRRLGQFERADRGTIFLDEVGEMGMNCQAKLLRILENHPFERLGGSTSISVDVRVVAATNRDLAEMVRRGDFRQDLFFRLRVIELETPPLRERKDDILTLARHFLDHFCSKMGRGQLVFSAAAEDKLLDYDWPGNVRELRNAVERAVAFAEDDTILPDDFTHLQNKSEILEPGELMSVDEAVNQHIAKVMSAVGGNKTEACRILGITRSTLYKKLKEARRLSESRRTILSL